MLRDRSVFPIQISSSAGVGPKTRSPASDVACRDDPARRRPCPEHSASCIDEVIDLGPPYSASDSVEHGVIGDEVVRWNSAHSQCSRACWAFAAVAV